MIFLIGGSLLTLSTLTIIVMAIWALHPEERKNLIYGLCGVSLVSFLLYLGVKLTVMGVIEVFGGTFFTGIS